MLALPSGPRPAEAYSEPGLCPGGKDAPLHLTQLLTNPRDWRPGASPNLASLQLSGNPTSLRTCFEKVHQCRKGMKIPCPAQARALVFTKR